MTVMKMEKNIRILMKIKKKMLVIKKENKEESVKKRLSLEVTVIMKTWKIKKKKDNRTTRNKGVQRNTELFRKKRKITWLHNHQKKVTSNLTITITIRKLLLSKNKKVKKTMVRMHMTSLLISLRYPSMRLKK